MAHDWLRKRKDIITRHFIASDIAAALKIILIMEKEQISGIWFF
jgi:hypothetical protein